MHLLCIAHALTLARAYSSAPASLRRQAAPLLPHGGARRDAAALCSRFTASIRAAFVLRYCPTGGNTLRSRAMFSFHCEHTRGDAGKCLERFAQINAII